jgi:hypothetical protein
MNRLVWGVSRTERGSVWLLVGSPNGNLNITTHFRLQSQNVNVYMITTVFPYEMGTQRYPLQLPSAGRSFLDLHPSSSSSSPSRLRRRLGLLPRCLRQLKSKWNFAALLLAACPPSKCCVSMVSCRMEASSAQEQDRSARCSCPRPRHPCCPIASRDAFCRHSKTASLCFLMRRILPLK